MIKSLVAKLIPPGSRPIFQTCVYGLSAGLSAVAFHYAIDFIDVNGLQRFANSGSAWEFLLCTFGMMIGSSLIAGWLLSSVCPEATGSGIPQVKVAFWRNFGYIPFRVAIVKFFACALSIGSGAALGREGPSVQIGSSVASTLAGQLGLPKQARRAAVAGGAAAALAAAFNAPLAAIVFVLEEIVEDLHSRLIGAMVLTSVIGAFCVYIFIGKNPAFNLPNVSEFRWVIYLFIPLIAIASSLSGIAFQVLTLNLRARFKLFSSIPLWLRPALGSLVAWALGVSVFLSTGHLGVFGLGYTDLTAALANQMTWQVAAILLITKICATSFCYGSGGSGGIFAPTLFFGGMCAAAITGIIKHYFILTHAEETLLIVVGLSTCLGAVVRAPITSILIVFEMTHEFGMVPALLIGTLISQLITKQLVKENFYQALLSQDGVELERIIPPRDFRTWSHYPVLSIANFQPILIDIDLPAEERTALLEFHSFQRFPVVKKIAEDQGTEIVGIVTREEALKATEENRSMQLQTPSICYQDYPISKIQKLLIESESFMIVILDSPQKKKPIAIFTLHDLLRAQQAFAQE